MYSQPDYGGLDLACFIMGIVPLCVSGGLETCPAPLMCGRDWRKKEEHSLATTYKIDECVDDIITVAQTVSEEKIHSLRYNTGKISYTEYWMRLIYYYG